MKKCAIVFTNRGTGEQFWGCSVDERGCTYCLRKRVSQIPKSHTEASEFYGNNRLKQAQRQIDANTKNRAWVGYTTEVIEYDREPEWYFEIRYVLEHAYKTRSHAPVPKTFSLRKDIDYRICDGQNRPFVCDLPLDELERLLEWRIAHFRGVVNDV